MDKVDSKTADYTATYNHKTPLQVIQTIESFVRSGNLRSVLERSGELRDHEIDYLVGLLRIQIQKR